MSGAVAARSALLLGVRVQARTTGAIIMRELHTRFGRDNIGYLWVILEPMLFGFGVAAVHVAISAHLPYGMTPATFYITGYVPFIIFRSLVLRAVPAIDANRGLLYHRQVTLFDIVFARSLLDAAATTFAMFLLLGLATVLGLGHLPDRPHLVFEGLGLMFWFCLGLAMLACAGAEVSTTVDRFLHPATYFMLPVSGVFFLIGWLPSTLREYVLWVPIPHIIETIREGEFGSFDSPYPDLLYVVWWCGALTFLGLLALRAVRPRIQVG